MNRLLITFLSLLGGAAALTSQPKVQVYTRAPGELGKSNTLICHVSDFHPPQILVELLRDGKEMPEARQTDLAFEENWHFHLTRHAPFTPRKGERVECRVTHLGRSKTFTWEPDM